MVGFREEYHLLRRVIDEAMLLVNISAMGIPGKSPFYENPLQTGRWKENNVFLLYKENRAIFNNE